MSLRIYLVSLAAGLLVGLIYGLLNVRSPAPPVVALVGLLGILLGEQAVPLAKRFFVAKEPVTVGEVRTSCGPRLFGKMPRAPETPEGQQPSIAPKA